MSFHWFLRDSMSPHRLQNISQYYDRFQQYGSLDGLNSSFHFQLFQLPFQTFVDCYEHANYNWYQCHLRIPKLS